MVLKTIECKADEKMKDIFKTFKLKVNAQDKILLFLYNRIYIRNEEEKTVNEISNKEDKTRSKINILVNETKDQPIPQLQDCIIKPNNIICPECYEDTKFTIEDYVINLSGCKNNHDIDNIFLDKFDSTQNINISKIICQDCKKFNKGNVFNNEFFRCNKCKKNLCLKCFIKHDKNHKIINYENKYYICDKHGKEFNSYCEDCKQDICILCENEHEKHKTISYGKLIPKEEIEVVKTVMPLAFNAFHVKMNMIIDRLNNIVKNFKIYFDTMERMLVNHNISNINYNKYISMIFLKICKI